MNPINHIMKLLTPARAAALLLSTALPLSAQTPAAAAPAQVKIPVGTLLERLDFTDVSMQEAVDYLSKKESDAGRDWNVVLATGLADLRIPGLQLRNVTTTEVLTVCATLLDLKVVPVPGDGGDRTAAWLVTPRGAPADPLAGGMGAAAPAPDVPGKVTPVATIASTAKSAVQSRVFGIASLLPKAAASDESKKVRAMQLDRLLEQLIQFAKQQDEAAELRVYPGLDIIVVRSSAMPLIEQAIEAMSKDAGSKALDYAESRVAQAEGRADEQNAMLGEANASLRALQRESETRQREMAEMEKRMQEMTKELETLRAAAKQPR